eukprot:1161376-Pelagomonas_calceolata.AAC.7
MATEARRQQGPHDSLAALSWLPASQWVPQRADTDAVKGRHRRRCKPGLADVGVSSVPRMAVQVLPEKKQLCAKDGHASPGGKNN